MPEVTREEMIAAVREAIEAPGGWASGGWYDAMGAVLRELEASGERWRHKKRGSTYSLIGTARTQATDCILEGDMVVVYRDDSDGTLWVRPTEEFYDGRFERVSPSTTSDGGEE